MFTSISSIGKIPKLNKDDIRTNYAELKSNNLASMVYQTRRSGGTTGEPIKSLISQKAAAFEVYTHFKGMSLMGWKQEMKMVKIFGGNLGVNEKKTLRSIILDYAQNSIQIPAFELDQKNIISIYRNLRSHKSLCIMGYASVIYNFFYFLRMNNCT